MTFTRVLGSGPIPAAVMTDMNGDWSQGGFQPGTTYRVTPSLGMYVFSPASQDFNTINASLNFSAFFISCSEPAATPITVEIGRASCRERGSCQAADVAVT